MKDFNIEDPLPLQKKIIKAAKDGNDLLIKAAIEDKPETGYLVPVLNQIAKQDRRQGTKAILITPDSKRAENLSKWIEKVGYHAGISSVSVTNLANREELKSALSAGPSIISATPKHFADILGENRMIFRDVQFLIIDSADDVNEWESLDRIMKRVISKHQKIVCTNNKGEEALQKLEKLLQDPIKIGFDKVREKSAAGENGQQKPVISKDLTQYYINVPPRMKISTLMAHLESTPSDTVVIFTASSRTADRLYRVFRKSGRRAASVHNGLNKKTFDERFSRFTDNTVQHLIAGAMSAAELDIEHVTQVINYDVPEEIEEYKNRAEMVGNGRATRIVSLVSKQDRRDIHEIVNQLGYAPEEIPLPEHVSKKKEKQKVKSSGKKEDKKKERPTRSPERSSSGDDEKPPMGLPRPSYDKLSGGRSGEKKEDKGIRGFFKKLFS